MSVCPLPAVAVSRVVLAVTVWVAVVAVGGAVRAPGGQSIAVVARSRMLVVELPVYVPKCAVIGPVLASAVEAFLMSTGVRLVRFFVEATVFLMIFGVLVVPGRPLLRESSPRWRAKRQDCGKQKKPLQHLFALASGSAPPRKLMPDPLNAC